MQQPIEPKPNERKSREQRFERSVERQAQQIRQADKDRPTLLKQTVYLGTIGVMMAAPIVAGAYLGRWLDSLSANYQVHWTVSMIFLGIVVGAVNVYLFVRE
jgi:ATP synthase protein I